MIEDKEFGEMKSDLANLKKDVEDMKSDGKEFREKMYGAINKIELKISPVAVRERAFWLFFAGVVSLIVYLARS